MIQHSKLATAAVSLLSLWLSTMPTIGQETHPRLIVRADDMGSFRAANIACLKGYTEGIESSIEVMVVTGSPRLPGCSGRIRASMSACT